MLDEYRAEQNPEILRGIKTNGFLKALFGPNPTHLQDTGYAEEPCAQQDQETAKAFKTIGFLKALFVANSAEIQREKDEVKETGNTVAGAILKIADELHCGRPGAALQHLTWAREANPKFKVPDEVVLEIFGPLVDIWIKQGSKVVLRKTVESMDTYLTDLTQGTAIRVRANSADASKEAAQETDENAGDTESHPEAN